MVFSRVLIRTAGVPAFRRAVPVYLGLTIIGGVIFGHNGMQPAELAAAAASSRGLRLTLWAMWLLATAPAAHALVHTGELDYLRWLPARRGHVCAVLMALLAVLHAPWAVFWALHGGIHSAAAALGMAVAVHALVSARSRNGLELGLGLALLGAAIAALAVPAATWMIIAGSVSLAVAAMPLAWARAVERRAVMPGRGMSRISSRPVLALAHIQVMSLWRTRPAVLARGLVIIALGAALTALMARANQLTADDLALYASIVAVIALALATAGLAAPLAEVEHALDWLVRSSGVSRDARTGARVLAAGLAGLVLGMAHGALAVWGAGAGVWGAARVIGLTAAAGAAMALIARRGAIWLESSPGATSATAPGVDSSAGGNVDGGRVVALVTVATIAALVAIAALGELAVLALLAFAVAVSMPGSRS